MAHAHVPTSERPELRPSRRSWADGAPPPQRAFSEQAAACRHRGQGARALPHALHFMGMTPQARYRHMAAAAAQLALPSSALLGA